MANLQQRSEEPVSALTFESSPWIAAERTIEEPRRAPEPPLRLEQDEHVVELPESDAIRIVR